MNLKIIEKSVTCQYPQHKPKPLVPPAPQSRILLIINILKGLYSSNFKCISNYRGTCPIHVTTVPFNAPSDWVWMRYSC